MDIAWFRQAQRRAGVTSFDLAEAIGRDRSVVSRIINGHQKATLDQARTIADALNVPLPELLQKLKLADAPTAQQLTPGFAESDAVPWVGPERESDVNRSIARALGGDRPGVDIWRAKGRALALAGILSGDFLLVDTHAAERVKPGDTVVAQIYDNRLGIALTVLRRYEPPVLVAASAEPEDQRVHVVDGTNVVVRGKVVAVWRT